MNPTPIDLDPHARDHHGEAARLRAAGPVVPVILPGGVHAWAATTHAAVAELVAHPQVSKNWRSWGAVRRGEVTDAWPLWGMLAVDNMVTADGTDHQRLRRPVARVLTPRRTEQMHASIHRIVGTLLDELPAHADENGTVDLRPHLAAAVPLRVICELVGVPDSWELEVRAVVEILFRTDTTPAQFADNDARRRTLLADLIALRRREPGDDLTSALIAINDREQTQLSDTELVDTLWLLLTAGHETTLSLITNAAHALLHHPDQRAHALNSEAWSEVVEETLRFDAPIGNFMARFAREDITLAGVPVPAGEAILACYSSTGRDDEQHGPDSGLFDLTRPRGQHLAFGGGPHFCPGAHLARAEAEICLRELFTRYPDMEATAEHLSPVPSLFSNSLSRLPVTLTSHDTGARP